MVTRLKKGEKNTYWSIPETEGSSQECGLGKGERQRGSYPSPDLGTRVLTFLAEEREV